MNVWSTVDRFLQMQASVVSTYNSPHPMGFDLFQRVRTVLDDHVSVEMLGREVNEINSNYALNINTDDITTSTHTLELHKEFAEYLIASQGIKQTVIRSPWTTISQTPDDENKYQMVYESAGTASVSVDVVKIFGENTSFRFASPTLSNAEIKKYAQFMVSTMCNNFMFRDSADLDKTAKATETGRIWKDNDKLLQMWIDNVKLEDNGENGVNMSFESKFVDELVKFAMDVNTILNLFHLVATLGGRP